MAMSRILGSKTGAQFLISFIRISTILYSFLHANDKSNLFDLCCKDGIYLASPSTVVVISHTALPAPEHALSRKATPSGKDVFVQKATPSVDYNLQNAVASVEDVDIQGATPSANDVLIKRVTSSTLNLAPSTMQSAVDLVVKSKVQAAPQNFQRTRQDPVPQAITSPFSTNSSIKKYVQIEELQQIMMNGRKTMGSSQFERESALAFNDYRGSHGHGVMIEPERVDQKSSRNETIRPGSVTRAYIRPQTSGIAETSSQASSQSCLLVAPTSNIVVCPVQVNPKAGNQQGQQRKRSSVKENPQVELRCQNKRVKVIFIFFMHIAFIRLKAYDFHVGIERYQ